VKVCIVSDSYPLHTPFGGVAVYTRTIARALTARGHEVHVLVPTRDQGSDLTDGAIEVHYRTARWLPLIGRFLPGLGESRELARALRELHERHHFDLVEFPNFEGLGLVAQWQNFVPIVVRLHTSMAETLETQQRGPRLGERYLMWAERQSVRRARAVVTHSRAHLEKQAAIYKISDIALIPHGIELPPTLPAASGRLTVLSLGRLSARKGGATLLAAIAKVCVQVPEATFMVVGAGEDEEAVRTFRAAHPSISPSQVVFRGFASQDELNDLYAAASVYASASVYESFGLPFVEAMGRGVPVVGCATSAMNEIIDDGKTGLLVPPHDAAALANAVVSLLRDPARRQAMGERGRQKALDHYTAERMAESVESWYQKVLKA
jgi:glycogen synthase